MAVWLASQQVVSGIGTYAKLLHWIFVMKSALMYVHPIAHVALLWDFVKRLEWEHVVWQTKAFKPAMLKGQTLEKSQNVAFCLSEQDHYLNTMFTAVWIYL